MSDEITNCKLDPNAPKLNVCKQETVTITKKEYEQLLKSAQWQSCLEAGGVDNWDWFSESLHDGGYFDDEEDDE